MNNYKRFVYFIRSFIISIEFALFLLWFPSHKFIESQIMILLKSNNIGETIKWICFLPCIILAFIMKESSNILRPFKDDKMKIFLEWPMYIIYKDKYYTNLLIQIICIVFSVYSFLMFNSANNYYFVITLFSCFISLVAAASNYFGGGVDLQNIFDLNYKQIEK